MEPDKNNSAEGENQAPSEVPQAPADALSRTPEDLEQTSSNESTVSDNGPNQPTPPAAKKPSVIKRLASKLNVYLLIFILLLVVAGVIAIVSYLNSQKPPVEPNINAQELTQEALQQLANTDASVGDTSKTLTIQGNAVIAGQTLMRGDLDVAGNIQSGGSIKGPSITISGDSNFGTTQATSLQVQGSMAVQGDTTLSNLNVAGTSSFGGAMTASQITVTNLILSGNATLEVPNHLGFTGPTPSRTINTSVLGSGGSASISGSDTAGTVKINTGGSPAAGCFVRVTFRQAFTGEPRVIISPVGSAAGQTRYYVDRDSAGFSICTASPAPAHKSFAYDYFITN